MTSAMYERLVEVPPSAVVVCAYRGRAAVVDQLADEWRELCDEAAEDQPFYRPEWMRAYLRFFAPSATVVLLAARLDGRLRLLLPLIEEMGTYCKVPVRKLKAPVNSCAGRFDAVYSAPPYGEAAIHAAWRYLRELEGWDLLQFRDALQGSAVSRLAAAAQADGLCTVQIKDNPSPYVPLSMDHELLKKLPVNARLRRELRHVRRQLEEQGSSLKLYRIEAADPDALNRFFQLEASGWKGQERSAILFKGTRPFFDEVAESAARFGYFTLYMLELNGHLIAAHFGFTHRACYYSVLVAYNESFREFSPGHLIIGEIVNDCATRGVRCYDTTGQNQEWKMKWTTDTRPLSHYFVFRGPLGNLAYAIGSKLKPAIGRLLAKPQKSA